MTARLASLAESIARGLDAAARTGAIRSWRWVNEPTVRADVPVFLVEHHGRCPIGGERLTVREAEVFCAALASARYAEALRQ